MALRHRHGRAAATVTALVLLSACSSDSDAPTPDTAPIASQPPSTEVAPSSSQAPVEATEPIEGQRVSLVEIASLNSPIAMSTRRTDPGLFVAERDGRVLRLDADGTTTDVILDLTDRVGTITSEQGLLGIAWSPDALSLIVSYTDGNDGGASVIERHSFAAGALDAQGVEELLRVPQPFANHNGGHVGFGPDGLLYIGLGDGGGQGDPNNNAQNPASLLGKILRIDIDSVDTGYAIPATNPFAHNTTGDQRREVWALGVRNPWRFSHDPATQTLWIADVGGSEFEEVNRVGVDSTSGANFGWNLREGSEPTPLGDAGEHSFIDPVFAYDHSVGSSITGGYVVRDPRLEALFGVYLFSDFVTSALWGIRVGDDGAVEHGQLDTLDVAPYSVVSFGRGPAEELYVVSLEGPIWRIDPA